MNNEYDQITANHYSAYRPFLHQPILIRCIDRERKYSLGLDIGCGTGQSSIALANHCDKVIGIEPSADMLANAIAHPQVKYFNYNGRDLAFENNQFDIITFAGSLFYAKSQELLDEVIRVAKNFTKIIVYDFELFLDKTLLDLKLDIKSNKEIGYNHQEDFSGLIQENLEMEKTVKEETYIQISPSNLFHLLLSSKDNFLLLF